MFTLGIDVSKNKIDICLLAAGVNGKKKHKVLTNKPGVAQRVTDWLDAPKYPSDSVTVVLEATGIYHENLAYGLHDAGVKVCMANPHRVREFACGMDILTKNDRADAFVLACYGELKHPDVWVPPSPEVRKLRALLRQRDALKEDVQRTANRLEKAHSTATPREVITSLQRTHSWLSDELERTEKLITDHTDNDPGLKADLELLKSIKGVKDQVGREMLAILKDGAFRSASQVAAYLGITPVEKTSGSSVRGRPHMSNTGPSGIRAKLYVAAMSASRWNKPAKEIYERLIARGKAKKAALGAVMHKLVHMCFGVLKTRLPWDENYAATA
ncbi:IS110 family RNA-guided transposase [Dryocola clanedunensis]